MTDTAIHCSVARGDELVEVIGELDAATVGILHSAVEQALDRCVTQLRVDLSGVTFCDSSGYEGLRRAEALARSRGLVLLLESPSRSVRRMLQLLASAAPAR